MIDEFVERIQPFFSRYQEGGSAGTFEKFVSDQRAEVADSLLNVTDKRAERAKNQTILKAYKKAAPEGPSLC